MYVCTHRNVSGYIIICKLFICRWKYLLTHWLLVIMTACSITKDHHDRSVAVVDIAGNDTTDKLSYACIIIHMCLYTCAYIYIYIYMYKQIVAHT
jgi:hypothetical protein